MIIELLISGIIGTGAPITIIDNKDGTVTVEGPSDNQERLTALYDALSERRRQVFDNNTEIFTLFNQHGSLFNVPDSLKDKISVLEAKNTVLHSEIEPLETEYKSLYVQMYPDMKDFIK